MSGATGQDGALATLGQSEVSREGRSLDLPVMGDPVKYINPFYTNQNASNSFQPLADYQNLMFGGGQGFQGGGAQVNQSFQVPMQQQQNWQEFVAPEMPRDFPGFLPDLFSDLSNGKKKSKMAQSFRDWNMRALERMRPNDITGGA